MTRVDECSVLDVRSVVILCWWDSSEKRKCRLAFSGGDGYSPAAVFSEIRRQQWHVLFLDRLFTEDRCRSLNSNHLNAHCRGDRQGRAHRGQHAGGKRQAARGVCSAGRPKWKSNMEVKYNHLCQLLNLLIIYSDGLLWQAGSLVLTATYSYFGEKDWEVCCTHI